MSVKEFKEKGYALVKNAINAELRDIITQYALFDEMKNFSPERGSYEEISVPGSHSKYADPLMESFLLYMLPLIEEKTNLKLYPTYSYYRVYRNGHMLYPHKDRPSCEISVTVCFNYSYNDSEYTWPIIMNGDKVKMKPGDIVVYRGVDLEHSREEFTPPNDDWHVQGFFHYVDTNGPYADFIYDGRQLIGQPKQSTNTKSYISFI